MRFWDISAPLCLIVALYILVHWRRDGWTVVSKNLLILVLPLVLSLTGFAIFDTLHYGTLLPNAGGIVFARQPDRPSLFVFNEKGSLGLLYDRTFGLMPLAPVYIVALAGAWVLLRQQLRQQPWVSLTILVISAICTFLPGFFIWWHGAWSPPARYLVSTVVLWAPLAALAFSNRKARPIVVALTMWSVFIAAAYTAFPLTRYSVWDSGKTGALSQVISTYTGLDYGLVFRSFIRANVIDYIMVTFWIGVTVLCIWILSKAPKRSAT